MTNLATLLTATFDAVYCFSRSSTRVRVFKKGKNTAEYVLCENTCTCPAGMHGVHCRHLQMREITFEGKGTKYTAAIEVLRALSRVLGKDSFPIPNLPIVNRIVLRRSGEQSELIVGIHKGLPVYIITEGGTNGVVSDSSH